MFDMRTWHTGLPNTNGQNRENMIFTYGGVGTYTPRSVSIPSIHPPLVVHPGTFLSISE